MGSSFVDSDLCSLSASHDTGETSQADLFGERGQKEKSVLTPQEGKGHIEDSQRKGHMQIASTYAVNSLCHPMHLLGKNVCLSYSQDDVKSKRQIKVLLNRLLLLCSLETTK